MQSPQVTALSLFGATTLFGVFAHSLCGRCTDRATNSIRCIAAPLLRMSPFCPVQQFAARIAAVEVRDVWLRPR
jgi:hypothetical protein